MRALHGRKKSGPRFKLDKHEGQRLETEQEPGSERRVGTREGEGGAWDAV